MVTKVALVDNSRMPLHHVPLKGVFVSDILHCIVAHFCTFAAIHISGYVGVLDINSMNEIYVRRRKGDGKNKIRNLDQHDIYIMNKEDQDRKFEDMNNDNEVQSN